MFVQNAMMYVFIVVFYGAEFNFSGPNTWNFIVHPFLESGSHPWEFLGQKMPPKFPFYKKDPFWPTTLVALLKLSKIKAKYVGAVKLSIFDLAKVLVWNPGAI